MCVGASFWKNALPYAPSGYRRIVDGRRDRLVVAQQIALRDPLVGPEGLVEIREAKLALAEPDHVGDRLLARHLTRALVLADAEVGGVAQVIVVRPLAEPDLRDELRLHPLHVAFAHAGHLRSDREGRRVAVQRPQQSQQLVDLGIVEARADVADVA
jgi:hypothetical protein